MTALSRRNLVASAAALPALAVPAAAAEGINHPDAELLRLGAALAPLEAKWLAQSQIDRKHRAAYKAALEAAGLPDRDYVEFPGGLEEAKAYWAKQSAVPYEGKTEDDADVDEYGASIVWGEINDRLWPLLNEILAKKASTLDGLKVQTRAIAHAAMDQWDPLGDVNPHERLFIEAVGAFLGVDVRTRHGITQKQRGAACWLPRAIPLTSEDCRPRSPCQGLSFWT